MDKKKLVIITITLAIITFAFTLLYDRAYASELPDIYGNTTIVPYSAGGSIWGIDFQELLEYWYPESELIEEQKRIVGWAVSQFVATDDEHFDDIVQHIIDNPVDFELTWMPDPLHSLGLSKPFIVYYNDNFYDNVKEYCETLFYDTSEPVVGGDFLIYSSGSWLKYGGANYGYASNSDRFNDGTILCWVKNGSSTGYILYFNPNIDFDLYSVCRSYCFGWGSSLSGSSGNYDFSQPKSDTPRGIWNNTCKYVLASAGSSLVYYSDGCLFNGIKPQCFDSIDDALTAYFMQGPPAPVLNGNGYILPYDNITNTSNTFEIIKNYNSKDVSNYYYTTYGETYESGDINTFNYYLTNTAIDYNYNFDIPYWLVNGDYPVSQYPSAVIDMPSVDDLPVAPNIDTTFIQSVFDILPTTITAMFLFMFCFGVVLLVIK